MIRHMYDLGVFRGIRSAGEWEAILQKVRKDAGLEVHHLIAKRFAEDVFGLDPDDVPAVVLDREFHWQVTGALFSKLPTGRTYDPQTIWNKYVEAYTELGHTDWLEAIWPYFAKKGVKR